MKIRMRLTVFYGLLFLLGGAVLLVLTGLLAWRNMTVNNRLSVNASDGVPADVWARQQQFQQDALSSLLTQGAIALCCVAVVAAICGWFIAGRALRPLVTITATARRIADGATRGLHERIALDGAHDEVRELADVFDSMLERLDAAFDSQRRFVANASHELRTPLALNRALVELAVTRSGAGDETRRLGESLLAVNERHERLIDGLLTLSDSENPVVERTAVDLADIVRHVVETADFGELTLESTVDSARTAGDPVLLERLVHNLVENAIRHNRPGGHVSIRTGPAATLVVGNTGPAVPAYEVESLFQPFRRLNRTRDRGFGLGLSIVRAVAQSHGGDATAAARDGGGLAVTVHLPT